MSKTFVVDHVVEVDKVVTQIDLSGFGPDHVPLTMTRTARTGRDVVELRYPFGKYGDQIMFMNVDDIPGLCALLRQFKPLPSPPPTFNPPKPLRSG